MCHQCLRLQPWFVDEGATKKSTNVKNEKIRIVHACKGCKIKLEYELPAGSTWVRNNGYGNLDRGNWLFVEEK